MKDSNAELLCMLLNEAYPCKWVTEYPAINGRKYRFDAADVSDKVLIEIDGGLHPFWRKFPDGSRLKVIKAGHSTAEGIERDMEKGNAAAVEGWRLLRYTPETLKLHPYKIMADLWKLIGKPTGKVSTAQLELTMLVQEKII